MTSKESEFKALMAMMRSSFLSELGERCHRLEVLLLALENAPDDRATFDELYRQVHSLKGAGGTHGLHLITRICHQIENDMAEGVDSGTLGQTASRGLRYVDLIARVEEVEGREPPDYSDIEGEFQEIMLSASPDKVKTLLVEESDLMAGVMEASLNGLPLRVIRCKNGLEALSLLMHDTFDVAVIGGELKDLNGFALLAALRASDGANRDLPVVLVTSNLARVNPGLRTDAVLERNSRLPAALRAAVSDLCTP